MELNYIEIEGVDFRNRKQACIFQSDRAIIKTAGRGAVSSENGKGERRLKEGVFK
jgi:hypothetical protein